MRQLRSAGAAGLGNRNDHVDFIGRHGGDHPFGQRLTKIQTRLVDRNAIHHRIGAGQVDELKNAGVERRRIGALLGLHVALQVDKHRFTRLDVALKLVGSSLQRHRLTGQHHIALAAPHAQGTNAVRVTKCQHTVTGNQRNHGIRTLDPAMHVAHRSEQVLRLQGRAACGALDFMSQHIEQDLGIALGIDVAVVGAEKFAFERVGIGQVAVMHQHNAERSVHIERLRFFFAEGIARRWVTHLAQTAVARQGAHVARAKHVLHHALGFVHKELAFLLGDDTRSVLAPVLQ